MNKHIEYSSIEDNSLLNIMMADRSPWEQAGTIPLAWLVHDHSFVFSILWAGLSGMIMMDYGSSM